MKWQVVSRDVTNERLTLWIIRHCQNGTGCRLTENDTNALGIILADYICDLFFE
jgi:hypothetical protein